MRKIQSILTLPLLTRFDPELAVLDQERVELLGRAGQRNLRAVARQRRLDRGLLHRGDGGVEDLLDDRRRRAGRHEHAVPELEVVVGQAGLLHAGQVGHERRALARADGERAQPSALTCGSTEGEVPKVTCVSPAMTDWIARCAALDTGRGSSARRSPELKSAAPQVRRRTVARRGVVELARILLGGGDQVLHRADAGGRG